MAVGCGRWLVVVNVTCKSKVNAEMQHTMIIVGRFFGVFVETLKMHHNYTKVVNLVSS